MPRKNAKRTKISAVDAALAGVTIAILLDFSRPAFAYLDPGTGSVLLQLLLGGVAGGLVVVKLYWHKFKGLFARKSVGTDQPARDNPRGE